jgi:ATP-binding cassette subfamily B protein
MVFQDVVLFSGTVRDNLRLGRPDATDDEVEAAARRAQAHDFIMALPSGYDTRLEDSGATLSGGERQRLSLARALLKDADVILLDEATASVDPTAEAAIQRAIDELVRGKTVIVIAHRLRTVRRASNIIVLNEGRVDDMGPHDELVARGGLYARLWARQSAGTALGHRGAADGARPPSLALETP